MSRVLLAKALGATAAKAKESQQLRRAAASANRTIYAAPPPELDAKSTSTPKPAAASKCAAISSIQTVSQLADAVSSAPLVVVKYYAPWCRLCLYVKPNFERVAKSAKERLAGAEFLEVDCGASRALVKLAAVSTLPCVHVYQGGELVSMHRIGKRQLFYEFEESIERLATYGV